MTERLLGRIKTDAKTDYAGGEHGESLTTMKHSPVGVRLRNDGMWHYWLDWQSPEVIHLDWDGVGWHAHSPYWLSGHVYRLANDSREFVDYLPILGNVPRAVLDRAHRYELRMRRSDPGAGYQDVWDLYEVATG
jgi:hypothetical protein